MLARLLGTRSYVTKAFYDKRVVVPGKGMRAFSASSGTAESARAHKLGGPSCEVDVLLVKELNDLVPFTMHSFGRRRIPRQEQATAQVLPPARSERIEPLRSYFAGGNPQLDPPWGRSQTVTVATPS
jgi:hypothetical protein